MLYQWSSIEQGSQDASKTGVKVMCIIIIIIIICEWKVMDASPMFLEGKNTHQLAFTVLMRTQNIIMSVADISDVGGGGGVATVWSPSKVRCRVSTSAPCVRFLLGG